MKDIHLFSVWLKSLQIVLPHDLGVVYHHLYQALVETSLRERNSFSVFMRGT